MMLKLMERNDIASINLQVLLISSLLGIAFCYHWPNFQIKNYYVNFVSVNVSCTFCGSKYNGQYTRLYCQQMNFTGNCNSSTLMIKSIKQKTSSPVKIFSHTAMVLTGWRCMHQQEVERLFFVKWLHTVGPKMVNSVGMLTWWFSWHFEGTASQMILQIWS